MIKWNIDDLVDKVMSDLDGKATARQVREVVLELTQRYNDAAVKTFVPVLVRRQAVDRLLAESEVTSQSLATQTRDR